MRGDGVNAQQGEEQRGSSKSSNQYEIESPVCGPRGKQFIERLNSHRSGRIYLANLRRHLTDQTSFFAHRMNHQSETINRPALQVVNVHISASGNFRRVSHIADDANDGHEFLVAIKVRIVDSLSDWIFPR